MDAGCGPCPLGPQYIEKGAKKVIALDYCPKMIASAKEEMGKKGISDKFDFVVASILEEDWKITEKVDSIVMSYLLTDFATSMDILVLALKNSKKYLKKGGSIIICDFGYIDLPIDDWIYGFTTTRQHKDPPKPFEFFYFTMKLAPGEKNELYNVPAEEMTESA